MNQDEAMDIKGGHETPPLTGSDYEVQTQGQPLSDFLMQLEDYSPTVRFYYN